MGRRGIGLVVDSVVGALALLAVGVILEDLWPGNSGVWWVVLAAAIAILLRRRWWPVFLSSPWRWRIAAIDIYLLVIWSILVIRPITSPIRLPIKVATLPQTSEELRNHLEEQVRFMLRSAAYYDQGQREEARRLASSLRILLHDSESEYSVLTQMRVKDDLLFANSIDPDHPENIVPFHGLVGITLTPAPVDDEYFPWLAFPRLPQVGSPVWQTAYGNISPPEKYIPFEQWWNMVVIDDKKGHKLSRGQMVISVAEQDGGARVSPVLNRDYAEISRRNARWWRGGGGKEGTKIRNLELATIRQITWEVFETLRPEFPEYFEERSKLDVELLLDEAWDLMGGGDGTTDIEEFADPASLELARRKIRDALILSPSNGSAHSKMGIYYQAVGKTGLAEQELRTAVKLSPDDPIARENLANILVIRGRTEEAIEELQKAVDLSDRIESSIFLAVLYKRSGQHGQAVSILEHAAKSGSGSAERLAEVGYLLATAGKNESAVTAYQQSIRLRPNEGTTHYNLANSLRLLNEYEAALASYKRAIELNPEDESARRNAILLEREIREQQMTTGTKQEDEDAKH